MPPKQSCTRNRFLFVSANLRTQNCSKDVLFVLPTETFHQILSYLSVQTLARLTLVSHSWRKAVADWIVLKSTARALAPSHRIPCGSNETLDEYAELGLLSRRLFREGSLVDRAMSCLTFIREVQKIDNIHYRDPSRQSFPSVALAMFCRVAVPLHLCPEQETCEAMWGLLRAGWGLESHVLDLGPGGEEELKLRRCLRLVFLSASPRDVPSLRLPEFATVRPRLLKALTWRMPLPQQARLFYICFGSRSGPAGAIDWDTPCIISATAPNIRNIIWLICELGAVMRELADETTDEHIFHLARCLSSIPRRWTCASESALLLSAGPRAAGAVLAGYIQDGSAHRAIGELDYKFAQSRPVKRLLSTSIGSIICHMEDTLDADFLTSIRSRVQRLCGYFKSAIH